MVQTLADVPVISQGDVEMVAIDYQDWLDGTELLTGTPTVAEQTTTDLTIGNEAVSTAQLTIRNRTVAIGKAVQFSVQGQMAGTTYRVRVTTSTDATPARTVVRDVTFETKA